MTSRMSLNRQAPISRISDLQVAHQTRWLNILLHLLNSREDEIIKLKTKMDVRTDLNDSTLISMIENIHSSEMSFIHNCRSLYSEKLRNLNAEIFEIVDVCPVN